MANLTLAVDASVLLEARKLALEKGTSVNQLVREYLTELVEQNGRRREARQALLAAMKARPLAVGASSWAREDLYER